MGAVWIPVLGFVLALLQVTVVSTTDESTCSPGFRSDLVIFKVSRKHLRQGTRLGKVGFTDCTDRTRFLFTTDDSRFVVHADGLVAVKREVVLHEGHRDFYVHSWDSEGRKKTVPVMVLHSRHGHGHRRHHHKHHHRHPHAEGEGEEQLHVAPTHQEQQHHSPTNNTQTAVDRDVPVIILPKSRNGLKRRKRDWLIPDINFPENNNGPYPVVITQVRSSEDMIKKIVYSVTGPGATEDPKGIFSMDKTTGQLLVHQRLDREKQAVYMLKAHAIPEGAPETEEPADIKIKVIDMNDNKPTFNQTTYVAEVLESAKGGTEVLRVYATDLDEPGNENSILKYSITDQEPKLPSNPMFEINTNTGVIMVSNVVLDREKHSEYTLEVTATDGNGNGFSGMTKVIIKVTDSNDNAPTFTAPSYKGSVEEGKEGVEVVRMTVTDEDEKNTPAWNAKFKIVSVSGGLVDLFSVKTGINKQEGILSVNKPLDYEASKVHTVLISVQNDIPFSTSLNTATTTVIVTVTDVNEAPVFRENPKTVQKKEDLGLGSEVIRYTADDPDIQREQTVGYKILRDPAGWLTVDEKTGVVKVKSLMDREYPQLDDGKYTALIGAYDNDVVPATGTGTLIIILEDVNDNPPSINERQVTLCRKDPVPAVLTVTDKDGPLHSNPYTVEVDERHASNWTARMNDNRTGIELVWKRSLPVGTYPVVLRVADRGNLDQDSSLMVRICDCTGAEGACFEGRAAGGDNLPIILGVMGALLLLLIILLMALFARTRSTSDNKLPPKSDDDDRADLIRYDDEGAGEEDYQGYDLRELHRGLDGRGRHPLTIVQMPYLEREYEYHPMPSNPEDVGNFIEDNLKAADNDPTAPPYDSLLVFDYEGGGSDAGSLSSLNSCSSGDQDYDCLNEWGPRFKKLADMYGGGEDDVL